MARVTVEDSLEKAKNRFALTHLTTQRTKQLLRGSKPLSKKKNNREVVTALREIAEGEVRYSHPEILNARSADVTMIESIESSTDVTEDASTE
ncbi:MAG: DNA-directed RNA polymerase subunit omega [Deltaproteobacteria bacterium]|nr:DNA-directed RNA polymerase subunit omega [Deltaproteobacteria bacterium]MBW2649238.1 DNA-directed RNA polymerase subunit omega [Deltaproteobacteria bacterium]